MTRVVEAVAPEFKKNLTWKKVVTRDPGGARRFKELSKALGKLLPIPSIVIEGKLVFETTPGVEVLRSCIDKIIKNMSNPS
jgi:hypothetical protein